MYLVAIRDLEQGGREKKLYKNTEVADKSEKYMFIVFCWCSSEGKKSVKVTKLHTLAVSQFYSERRKERIASTALQVFFQVCLG